MIRQQIIAALENALSELGVEGIESSLSHSEDLSHGDYSSNVALVAAKQQKKNPLELAQQIADQIKASQEALPVERIAVAPPGFINFWVAKESLISNVDLVLTSGEKFGTSIQLQNKKVMVEFTDPNPFKEFHIGHLYSNIVGETLARLFASQGAQVKRANYQGDVGLHVAKALYGMLQDPSLKSQISSLENQSLKKRAEFLGQAYALGAKAYEESGVAKQEINNINKKVYENDPSINDLYNQGRKWSLDYFESVYNRLGTKFNYYYFESTAGPVGLNEVKENMKKGIFVSSNGAVIFEGEKYGLHNRVFINSLGLPTYEAKELGLATTKYKDFPYDLSVIVTGNEINEYFKVLLKALSLIHPDLAAKTRHVSHGMVRLPGGKMSSRTGDVITGEWLLDEAKKAVKDQYPDMNDEVAEQVGTGAVKYALLKNSLGKDVIFDFKESISFEGNSGPYLQYTYARTQSVTRKSQIDRKLDIGNWTLEIEEEVLLRMLQKYPEAVAEAAEKYAPNVVSGYLFHLAQAFNLFYQKQPIIGSPKEAFRLQLTQAVGQILKNGLSLLGIEAPSRM